MQLDTNTKDRPIVFLAMAHRNRCKSSGASYIPWTRLGIYLVFYLLVHGLVLFLAFFLFYFLNTRRGEKKLDCCLYMCEGERRRRIDRREIRERGGGHKTKRRKRGDFEEGGFFF